MKQILLAHSLYPESFVCPDGYKLIKPQTGAFSSDELAHLITVCDAFVPMFNTPVHKDLLMAAKRLKVVSNVGVGYNNIDVSFASQLGIAVCNTPDVVTEPTAELTIALLLDVARGITRSHMAMVQGQERWGVLENIGNDVYGKTLGIVGLGRIGQAVARRAKAMGMRILYNSRNRVAASIETALGATYMPLQEVMSQSDYISLHTPLTEQTHHLIDSSMLSICKPTAFLINTARGPVIDEEALIAALSNASIAGAALDVYEYEPKVSDEMRRLPNVVLLPHIGTATRETRNKMAAMALNNVVSFFRGVPLNVVNADFYQKSLAK